MDDQTFKALVVTEVEKGKFERSIQTKNISDLPEGDVLIQVHYSSLNYKDALSATGNKGVTQKFPHTPGIDAAGLVVESDNENFQPGDEVIVTGYDLGMNTAGGYGQYIRVSGDWVIHCPPTLDLKEAMVYGTAGLTAALSVDKLLQNGAKPEQGEILVTGATGGVGSVAVAILSKLGFDVVAATGKPEAADFLKKLGAKEVINRDDIVDDSKRPFLKPRWAGVVDTVAGATLETALKTLKPGGSVTCCGMITAMKFSASIFPFILRGVNLLGIDSVEIPKAYKVAMWKLMANEWKVDGLEELCTLGSLEDLDDRIEAILEGKAKGRFVVKLDPEA
ncbi:MAG: oxidoreductase [SAR324 cluster bacterium]|uniref:Oxidoreductase n=1 Tax=SAR324 cluster bacterium TaxID=2024889 RepID=A0A2A4SL68_9DELT|nr:MAG: oxidoreductase [SAR324 cluster bacterium]